MASAALAAELSALKMGALSRRAVEAGVDADALEAAQDEGDRAAIIALIVAREVDPVEELRAELRTLKLGALSKRAVAAGVEGDALEAAQDDGDKAAIIELIVARTAAIPEGVPSDAVAMGLAGGAAAAAAAPSSPQPAVAAAPSITTVAELAAAARCTEPEVLALADGELTELLLELQVGLALRIGPRSRSGCECSALTALTAPPPRCGLHRSASSAASASSRTCGPARRRPGRRSWRRPTTPTREASASCWRCRTQTRSWPPPAASA
eukprot:COSAG01_NODE_14741_length_1414_cov_12.485562_1_plen_269_part_00